MSMVSLNTYDGPYPPGVPNPYYPRVHPYPTRYHGPIYTRPQFGLQWTAQPYDFGVPAGMGSENGNGGAPPAPPRDEVQCDQTYPVPDEVEDAQSFADYLQNKACHERVQAAASSRRWLIGLGLAFVAGALVAKAG